MAEYRSGSSGQHQQPEAAHLPPSPHHRHRERVDPGDAMRWSDGLSEFLSQQAVYQLGPAGDQFFRLATDPYDGRTYKSRQATSIGCAGALLFELLHTAAHVDGRERSLLVVAAGQDGRMRAFPDARALRDKPPDDPLLHQLLAQLVDDTHDAARPVGPRHRTVHEVVEWLAKDAYARVADRLVTKRTMVEGSRRPWPLGRAEQVWVVAQSNDRTASINLMMRLPRVVHDAQAATLTDRFLLGLIDAIDLTDRVLHEYGDKPRARRGRRRQPGVGSGWSWPTLADLRLPPAEEAVVLAVDHVRAAAARGYGR
ncbi:hypothetical protein GCM10022220_43660 [Actinocatenispora rupis]|uniref:Golgi phosphoprotein 3 (GPP34) n=2 Tax=Actinocatenispora rupis TaxID=519421 RepID=A0A8J3NFI0_9ACTN|nr:hypothetical protein Aru02nite_57890 [Actinocatenispora rupis]